MSDGVSDYIRVPGGEPTRDVLKLVRPELRADVRTALLISSQQRTETAVRGALVPGDGSEVRVNVRVRPVLRTGSPPRGHFLIIFEQDQAEPLVAQPTELLTRGEGEPEQLHQELARVNEQLRITLERSAVRSRKRRPRTKSCRR
jgi:two-component system CheB/CheR fusion protein